MGEAMMLITEEGHDKAVTAAYNRGWNDCTLMIAEQTKARLSKHAQRTSREAVARNAASIKGIRRLVLTALQGNPLGLTDFDLESALGRTHQSVSAARNALMRSGLVCDSGKVRPNARGNNSIVWMLTSPSSEDVDVRNPDPVPVPVPPSDDSTTHTCHPSGLYFDPKCEACCRERHPSGRE